MKAYFNLHCIAVMVLCFLMFSCGTSSSSTKQKAEPIIVDSPQKPTVKDESVVIDSPQEPVAKVDPSVPQALENDQDEITKKILAFEEKINESDFSGLEGLKKLLQENPEYPNRPLLEEAIKNWELEFHWRKLNPKVESLLSELKKGGEVIGELEKIVEENPQYPLRQKIESEITAYRNKHLWDEIDKQVEWSGYFLDKGRFDDLDLLKKLMKENVDYPRRSEVDKRIKKWEHELFLINVPL